jgi:hypothetical protein
MNITHKLIVTAVVGSAFVAPAFAGSSGPSSSRFNGIPTAQGALSNHQTNSNAIDHSRASSVLDTISKGPPQGQIGMGSVVSPIASGRPHPSH